MANYDQPVSSGLEAAEAMRALAHATLKFDDQPEDTFSVLGDMLSITSSYVSVLTNIAQAHERKIDDAHDDQSRDHEAGRMLARAAAHSLRHAAFQIADAYRHVDDATQMSSRIVWFPHAPALRTPREPRRASPRPGIGPEAAEMGTAVSPTRSVPSPSARDSTRAEGRSL